MSGMADEGTSLGTPRTSESHLEATLVAALRERKEEAFLELFRNLYKPMLRIATSILRNKQEAEEAVQEAWLGVVRGIDGFEGRSSLRTWIFAILFNQARSHAKKMGRMVRFSPFEQETETPGEPCVDPRFFRPPTHPDPCRWAMPPAPWEENPEKRLLTEETFKIAREAIDDLPEAQRLVITLRDIEGCTAREVCDLLGLSDANHRVLLHRARTKVRHALNKYWENT